MLWRVCSCLYGAGCFDTCIVVSLNVVFSVFFFFFYIIFFFQAEVGIRDKLVTGVQTCALPISHPCTSFDNSFSGAQANPGVPPYNSAV